VLQRNLLSPDSGRNVETQNMEVAGPSEMLVNTSNRTFIALQWQTNVLMQPLKINHASYK
jgi:hypothetical protein